MLESYSKVINIEALTMIYMAKKSIIPAVAKYTKELSEGIEVKKKLDIQYGYEWQVATRLSTLNTEAYQKTLDLEKAVASTNAEKDVCAKAKLHETAVLATMNELRAIVDEMETMTSSEYWPMPSYSDLMFNI